MTLRADFPSLPESTTELRFLKDLPEYEKEKPYHISGPLHERYRGFRTNIHYESVPQVPIFNLRGHQHKLSIERHGFEMFQVPKDIAALDVKGNEAERDRYAEAMVTAVKQRLKATFALCYNFKFRSSVLGPETPHHDVSVGSSERPDAPAEAAHIDHTPESAMRRARRHLTAEEANIYLSGAWRVQIVNVWKPLGPVHNHDLLYCDFSTVRPSDLVAVDRASSEYVGEVYLLKPGRHYGWYWIDHQTAEEASVFISYDSHPGCGAPYCPHTAGRRPSANGDAVPRESIELRLLVFSKA
ncbi:hypothetical protein QBC42DRAFT_272422 [Cladorrhinum samala]|uniref:Methyltransferase n=1 Tax=Cladorrhinum samala TaxID=585594 RepID=A0AAV9HK74_9PEZI|nr:hypothetical protein QBC42DRAFT_272422 [Cladorrhinum samala]